MKINYDKNTDSLSIIFKNDTVDDSEEIKPGVIVDFNEEGSLLSIELLNASKKVELLNKLFIEDKVLELQLV